MVAPLNNRSKSSEKDLNKETVNQVDKFVDPEGNGVSSSTSTAYNFQNTNFQFFGHLVNQENMVQRPTWLCNAVMIRVFKLRISKEDHCI